MVVPSTAAGALPLEDPGHLSPSRPPISAPTRSHAPQSHPGKHVLHRIDIESRLLIWMRGDESPITAAPDDPWVPPSPSAPPASVRAARPRRPRLAASTRREPPPALAGKRAIRVVAYATGARGEHGGRYGLHGLRRYEAHQLEPAGRRRLQGIHVAQSQRPPGNLGQTSAGSVKVGVAGDQIELRPPDCAAGARGAEIRRSDRTGENSRG